MRQILCDCCRSPIYDQKCYCEFEGICDTHEVVFITEKIDSTSDRKKSNVCFNCQHRLLGEYLNSVYGGRSQE